MRLFLFVVVLALAVLGALAVPPPPLPPGADGWKYCTSGTSATSKARCHQATGSWDVNGVEYLVMLKEIGNKGLALTRIASGNSTLCRADWFGGQPTSAYHDCYFTKVDGTFIKSPVSEKGWSTTQHVYDDIVKLGAGLWAIKYQNKYDARNYVVGLSGANVPVNHACRDQMVGMTFHANPLQGGVSPISGAKRDEGLCFVSEDPVIAAGDMEHFDECARLGGTCVLPWTESKKAGVILRIGSHSTNNWQYKQIFAYKEGEGILCGTRFFRAQYAGSEVCEFFNPPADRAPTFINNFAGWVKKEEHQGFYGDPPITYTLTTSVSSTRGEDRSKEWGEALTKSIETSVAFGDVEFSVGLSSEQSKSVSEGVSTELSRGTQQQFQVPCSIQPEKRYCAIYTWEVSGVEVNPSQTLPDSTYAVNTVSSACVDSPNPPCCPPGYWTDIKCHDGTSPFVVATDCKKFTKARPTLR
jgi:hypothetical protein